MAVVLGYETLSALAGVLFLSLFKWDSCHLVRTLILALFSQSELACQKPTSLPISECGYEVTNLRRMAYKYLQVIFEVLYLSRN